MKDVNPSSLYIKKLDVYDSKTIQDCVFVKNKNKFINIKSEKAVDLDINDLIKMVRNDVEFGKLSMEDLKHILIRFTTKPNTKPVFTIRRENSGENLASYMTYDVNPYYFEFEKYNKFIINGNELEKLKKDGTGSLIIKGIVATDGQTNYVLRANFNYDNEDEPIFEYFTRKIKPLAQVKKKGLFFK